jgi:hypothetical protein
MVDLLFSALPILNRILVAGIAITAFSLLLYALSFGLRERVTRAFALILACIALISVFDGLASTSHGLAEADIWLRLEWVGIALLPAGYLHFSDALLSSVGRPSRGRRRLAVRATYLVAGIMVFLANLSNEIVTSPRFDGGLVHLEAGAWAWVFALYAIPLVLFAGVNLFRAYRLCQTGTSRRRIAYLMVGSLAPGMAAFPYLLFLGDIAALHPYLIRTLLILCNGTAAALLVVLAYSTSYFGVAYSDRVVKGRLFQWLLRGPFVTGVVIAVMVIAGSFFERIGLPNSRLILVMVAVVIVLLQFFITVARLPVERVMFYGSRADSVDIHRLQLLEERLLTRSDMRQFLEMLLAALCDVTGSPAAFIIRWTEEGTAFEAGVGDAKLLPLETDLTSLPQPEVLEYIPGAGSLFRWGSFWLFPLHDPETDAMLGLMGLAAVSETLSLSVDQRERLSRLTARATLALKDQRIQREIFSILDRLIPDVETIQQLSAAARYGHADLISAPAEVNGGYGSDLAQWVRDALSHYWGGPKLTGSPLLGLRIVREELQTHDGNTAHAIRAVLRRAVEQVRPLGERRFTSEWVLYNILEMKFLEGKKVRDVAMRLAVSEADLYRKQKVAIEEVARVIAEMERQSNDQAVDYEVVG